MLHHGHVWQSSRWNCENEVAASSSPERQQPSQRLICTVPQMGSVRAQSGMEAGGLQLTNAASAGAPEVLASDEVRFFTSRRNVTPAAAELYCLLLAIFLQELAVVISDVCAHLHIPLAQCWVRCMSPYGGSALVTSSSLPSFLTNPFLEARTRVSPQTWCRRTLSGNLKRLRWSHGCAGSARRWPEGAESARLERQLARARRSV